jgi:integrase
MSKWIKSAFKGVRYREHPTRKHGLQRDRYYSIRIKLDGKDKEEGLGWASEWKASTSEIKESLKRGGEKLPDVLTEQVASEIRDKLQTAKRYGVGAVTLAERRVKASQERKDRQELEAQQTREALTFSEFFTAHYAPHACQDKKHCSFRREDALFRNWISKAIGNRPLRKIGVVDLERLKRIMAEGKLKPRTIEYALAVVRQVFNHARRTGFYESESPTRLVKKPKVNNARLRYLEHAQADTLLKELAGISPDVRDMALLSLHCGLRFGEAAALAWSNVDLSKGLLTLLDTKHGDRQVPMTAQVRAMLEGRAWDGPSGLVFPARGGGLRGRISKTFMQAVDGLGLNAGREDARERVCFHTLRHTFASWHVLAGTDLYTLGRLMGHKTPSMTARYGHLSPEGAARATRAFEASMEQQSKKSKVVNLETNR